MVTLPPGAGVAEFIAFALVDELIRTLVDKEVLIPLDAANMIDRVIKSLRGTTMATAQKAIPVLEEMLREYRKQAR